MGVSTPHLSPRTLLASRRVERTVVDRHREADVRECRLVADGKSALVETLGRMDADDGDRVLLPALVTDGVVGAVEAAGYDPAFYRVRPDLGANCHDLRSQADETTAAVVAVHYFGFENPSIDAIGDLTDEVGARLVVDNAHSPTSRDGTAPLATTGDVGFTSLHKQFPVPDGALLTVSDPDLAHDTASAFASAGVDPTPSQSDGPSWSTDDLAFCVESTCRYVGRQACRLRSIGSRVDGRVTPIRTDGGGPSARERSEGRSDSGSDDGRSTRADEPSGVSKRVVDRVDPEAVSSRRRRNYRYWLDSLSRSSAPEMLYPDLSAGTVPQVFPVLVEDFEDFRRRLRGPSLPASTWPPLPTAVRGNDDFPLANHLADRLVRLPVHQGLDVHDLAPMVAAVQRYQGPPSTSMDR